MALLIGYSILPSVICPELPLGLYSQPTPQNSSHWTNEPIFLVLLHLARYFR